MDAVTGTIAAAAAAAALAAFFSLLSAAARRPEDEERLEAHLRDRETWLARRLAARRAKREGAERLHRELRERKLRDVRDKLAPAAALPRETAAAPADRPAVTDPANAAAIVKLLIAGGGSR